MLTASFPWNLMSGKMQLNHRLPYREPVVFLLLSVSMLAAKTAKVETK